MHYRERRTVDCGTVIADDTRIATTEMVVVPIVSPPNRFPLPNASTELSGQVALVTGATAGLGRRFAGSTLYLAAPASEFVTGTVVKVDDGNSPAEPIPSRSDLSRAPEPRHSQSFRHCEVGNAPKVTGPADVRQVLTIY